MLSSISSTIIFAVKSSLLSSIKINSYGNSRDLESLIIFEIFFSSFLQGIITDAFFNEYSLTTNNSRGTFYSLERGPVIHISFVAGPQSITFPFRGAPVIYIKIFQLSLSGRARSGAVKCICSGANKRLGAGNLGFKA